MANMQPSHSPHHSLARSRDVVLVVFGNVAHTLRSCAGIEFTQNVA